jgi:hypothetical protein
MARAESDKIRGLQLTREAATITTPTGSDRVSDTPMVVVHKNRAVVEYGARNRVYSFTRDSIGRLYLDRDDSVNPGTNRKAIGLARELARKRFEEMPERLKQMRSE